jgi:hypothetical protein
MWLLVAYLSIWRLAMQRMYQHAIKTSPASYAVACCKFCVLCLMWVLVAVMLFVSIAVTPIWLFVGWLWWGGDAEEADEMLAPQSVSQSAVDGDKDGMLYECVRFVVLSYA